MSITPYITHIAILIGIYSLLAISLNLAIGYTGLINLAQVALFGIGAYTSTLLVINGIPFTVSFLLAGIAAMATGALLVFITKDLEGDYYALATLAFSFVIVSLMTNLKWLTNGPLGISGIPNPSLLGITIQSNLSYLIFTLVITSASTYLIYQIVQSPFGRVIEAMRDDQIGVKVLGKNTNKLKYKMMSLSAFFAGISGSLFAHYITYINPTSFSLSQLITILIIVILGGLASIKGSIIGTAIILIIPELLRLLNLPSSILGPARQIIYSIILLAILIYKPKGLFGKVDLE